MPLLLLGTGATLSAAPGGAGGGRAAADASSRPGGGVGSLKLAFKLPADPTTTTTAPPATTTTVAPAPTTTTRPVPPTTTTTAPPSSADGVATWYAQSPPGGCASPWLPRGVTLKVTDLATGASITCVVDDREAAGAPHVVDLSPSSFEQLAPLSQGTIQVSVSW